MKITREEAEQEFKAYLEGLGLIIEGIPIMDGKKHRVSVESNPNGKDGEYVGYLDGHPAGYARNYTESYNPTWKAKGYLEETRFSKDEYERKREIAKKEAEETKKKAVQALKKKLKSYKSVKNHPYLSKKQIETDDQILVNPVYNSLIIPIYDENGELKSASWISENGTKGYFKDTPKKGNFTIINCDEKIKNFYKKEIPNIYISEGWATGKTIAKITKLPIIIAHDCHNLLPVAEKLRKDHPESKIIIFADNDRSKKENWGKKAAKEAADKTNARIVMPMFEVGVEGSDFNDLYVHDKKIARNQILEAVKEREIKKKIISR